MAQLADNPERSTIFVVDDDLSVREALSSLIRSVGLAVETFSSVADFMRRWQTPAWTPCCLVLDVRMPGMSGLELQREMASWSRQPPIVFITGHGDIPMTVRAIKAGAVEFLPKPFRDQDLLDAIHQSLQIDRLALRDGADRASLQARYDTLTQREREVITLMVQGLRNKQAADQLGISEVTVKVHRHNIMEKMQAPSVPALVAMMGQLGTFPR